VAVVALDDLLACLEVREVGPGRWQAPNLDMAYRRIFGGQLLAQAIALGAATTEAKSVKSLSCLFPREGRLDDPFEFAVEANQTGRAFAARRISAAQDDKVFFLAQLSMHSTEDGPEHEDPMPAVGGPAQATPTDLGMIPWECRVVGGVDLADPAGADPTYEFWTRVGERTLDDSPAVHQALLAYATDLTLIGTALRPHRGISQADAHETLHTAVTGHTLWFHRSFRIDDWCLVAQRSPVTAGARAFGQGHVFDAAGHLVASFAQEAMIRPIP